MKSIKLFIKQFFCKHTSKQTMYEGPNEAWVECVKCGKQWTLWGQMKHTVLIKAVAGSHLFGTNTENSDHDYKGVFIPSAEAILTGDYSDTIKSTTGDDKSKNTKDDVDTEMYSLRKFFAMLENGDTAAIELLFTPDEMILEKNKLWDKIVEHRHIFISKKINALIGYARQQANKYGIKGSRMGELNNVLKLLKGVEAKLAFKNAKLKHGWDEIVEGIKDFQHCHVIEISIAKDKMSPALDILGKKFSEDTPLSVINKCLSDEYKKYGERAREAKANNGVDFKALSHAVRCMLQGIELMNTGKITLPHQGENLELIRQIKAGAIPYPQLEPVIEQKMKELEEAAKNSSLEEALDKELLRGMLVELHLFSITAFIVDGILDHL